MAAPGQTPSSNSTPSNTGLSSQSVDKVIDALIKVLQQATSPDAIETQQILLRRLALSGDVIPSKVSPPRNITEIGGYLNLLQQMGGDLTDPDDMRTQVLGAILGVAGPSLRFEPFSTQPTLSLVAMNNDRPPGTDQLQAAVPNQFYVRSDLVDSVEATVREIHSHGALIPLIGAPRALPGPNSTFDSTRIMAYLGREISMPTAAALIDPKTDPIVVGRVPPPPPARPDPRQAFLVAARVALPGAPGSAIPGVADWECIQSDGRGGFTIVAVAGATFLSVKDYFNKYGWYQPSFGVDPSRPFVNKDWARWTNIDGLTPGMTLGEELGRLHSQSEIMGSTFAKNVNWVWEGASFQPPV
jgi:hypothetical protein